MSCDVGEVTKRLENLLYISISMSFAHSPNFPSLHLRHSSISNHSVALPTSQLILQYLRCFIYVTTHSPTLLSPLRLKLFTYVSWRTAHASISRLWMTLQGILIYKNILINILHNFGHDRCCALITTFIRTPSTLNYSGGGRLRTPRLLKI